MPTIRYQIRNEYGLASPELYHSADKDDPEAILEGVAMAGLVGVLRQLGDLAEFAAEIFHDLHEEVMATAARGHGMMLRVQQLEAELPSVENALLCQTSHRNFADNAGIDWHTILQMDQNLITKGDMPRFILDSYEECHGPPRLFTLDKFDVAGAGACLKRYSDPSFFKINLASSDKMEMEVHREKKARKTKQKRGPRLRNGETLESLLTPQNDSNSQVNSDEVSKAVPTRRVTLKHRHVDDVNRSTRRSYMQSLLEVPLPEENVLSKNSKSQPDKKMKSIVLVESANSPLSREGSPSHSPMQQGVVVLPANKLDEQSINDEELLEALSERIGDVPSEKEVLTEVDNELVRNTNGYHLYDEESSLLKELLTNADYRTGGSPDGYLSDGVISEVETFVDALNTMESDLEADSESRGKLDPVVLNVKLQVMVYESKEGQQELQTHPPENDPVQNSPRSLANLVNRSVSGSTSDIVGDVSDAQPPQPNIVHSTVFVGSEICADEICGSTSEAISRNGEAIEEKALHGIISDGTYSDLELNGKNPRPELREPSHSSCVTDPTSNLPHLYPEERFDEAHTVATDQCDILLDHVEGISEVAKHLHDNLACTSENLEIPTQVFGEVKYFRSAEVLDNPSDALLDKNDVACSRLEGIDVSESIGPENSAGELTLGDAADISGMPDSLLQTQEKCILVKVPHCLEEPAVPATVETKETADTMELDAAHALEGIPETIISLSQGHIPSCLPSDSVIAETPNVATTEDLTYSRRTSDLKDAYYSVESNTLSSNVPPVEPNQVTDTEKPVQSKIMEPEELASLSSGERSLLDERTLRPELDFENVDGPMHYSWNLYFGSDAVAVEADSDNHGPCSCPPEASGLHAQYQEDMAAGVTLLKHNNLLETNEMANAEDISTTPSGSTKNIFSSPEKEDQQMLTPKVSSYELPDEDSVDAISEPLDGVYSSVPPVHAQRDLNLAKTEADVHLLKFEDAFDSLAASQCSNEIIEEVMSSYGHLPPDPAIIVEEASKVEAGNEIYIISSLEGGKDHDLCGIQLESALLAEQNVISVNPIDFNNRLAEPDEEQDSHATESAPLAKQNDMSIHYIDFNVRSLEPDEERDSHAISSNDDFEKLLLPISNMDISNQLDPEDSDPECTSEVPATSVALDISAAALPTPPGVSLEQSGTGGQLEQKNTDPECTSEVPATSLALHISAAALRSPPEDSLEQSGTGRQLEQEDTDPEQAYEVPATSLALSISAAASPSPPCFGLVHSEASFEQSVGSQVGKSISIVPSESIGMTPSLPPLPPLEWRMGKLRLGSVTSDGKSNKLLAELNLLPEPSTQVEKHQHSIPSTGFQMFQPASSSSSLPALEGENIQHDSLNLGERRQRPLRLADLPPIPDDSTSRLEDCKNLQSHDVLREGISQPSHLFAPIPTLNDTVSLSEPLVVQPNVDDGRRGLDQLLPEVVLERSHCCTTNSEGDLVQPTDTFLSASTPGVEKHHYLHGVYGSENLQLMNLSIPQQYGEPKLYEHDFLYVHGNPYAAYGMTFPTIEGEKPNGKLHSIRNRPRDPLIEAVASHDKSTLRKVSEMARPLTKTKEDERNTFLEQIKNKSFSLKPTVTTKPNIKGPPTNIKVAAILEKANAIRQAFVGSDDDDDDGDSWSDT